jgi:hypothetical protein
MLINGERPPFEGFRIAIAALPGLHFRDALQQCGVMEVVFRISRLEHGQGALCNRDGIGIAIDLEQLVPPAASVRPLRPHPGPLAAQAQTALRRQRTQPQMYA